MLTSDAQRPGDDALLPCNEPPRRLHVAAVVRHRRLQLEERRRAEHRLRQLRPQVSRSFLNAPTLDWKTGRLKI